MKRVLILVLCLLLIASSAMAADLTVWMPPFGSQDSLDKDFWQAKLDAYAADKGLEISVEITPWNGYEQKYLTGIASDAGPDVGYMYVEMVNDFINMGALEPLDNYVTSADFDKYYYLKNGYFQGNLYMFPIVVGNPRMLVVNLDILREAGLDRAPQTWDELVTWGLAIKEKCPDVYPMLMNWGDTNTSSMNTLFYPFLWSAGGEIFNEDQTVLTLDTPEAIKAAQFLYDLRFKYDIMPDVVTSLSGDDVFNSFLEGKTAMIMTASTGVSSRIVPSGMNWDYAILKDVKQATFVALDCLVIPSNAKNKDLAFDVIKYMTSGAVMSDFHSELSVFPPVSTEEEYGDLEEFKSMYEDPNIEFRNYPAVAKMYMVNDALYKDLQMMLLGELSPEEVMQEITVYGATLFQ